MKRFRVSENLDFERIVAKFDTLQEVVDYCYSRKDISPSYLNVECLEDDIKIDCDELLGAFEDGECPMDSNIQGRI